MADSKASTSTPVSVESWTTLAVRVETSAEEAMHHSSRLFEELKHSEVQGIDMVRITL